MRILDMLYRPLHRLFSRPSERGEYSSGVWQDMVRRAVLDLCAGKRGTALEIGCGEGLFAVQLKQREPGLEVWGIDNDAARLEQAKAKARERGLEINFSLGDAGRLPYPDASFDLVICANVFLILGSLGAIEAFLSEMKRVCRKDGSIIFDYRNSRNPLLRLKYALAPYYDHSVRHLRLTTCDPRWIERALRGLGLKAVRQRNLGFFIRWLAPLIIVEAGQ